MSTSATSCRLRRILSDNSIRRGDFQEVSDGLTAISVNYFAQHAALLYLDFMYNDEISKTRFNVSEQGCTFSSTMTDDHR